jgi:hypothetical protein
VEYHPPRFATRCGADRAALPALSWRIGLAISGVAALALAAVVLFAPFRGLVNR